MTVIAASGTGQTLQNSVCEVS